MKTLCILAKGQLSNVFSNLLILRNFLVEPILQSSLQEENIISITSKVWLWLCLLVQVNSSQLTLILRKR